MTAMRMRFAARGLAILALTVVPLASGAADPYEINALIPQTGPQTLFGKSFTETLSVIEGIVNKSGGIRGRPIKFVIWDSPNPEVSVQLANALMAKNVPVIIGPSGSASCNAVLPLLRNGPVSYCLSPALYPPAGSFAFSAGVTTLTSLQVMLHYFRARGWNRVGIITSIDAAGQDAERSIDEAFANEKDEAVTDREHFNSADISVSAQMAHLARSGAQVIIAWATGTPFVTLIRGAHDAGIDVPLATSNSNVLFTQLEELRPFLPTNLYFAGFPSAATVAQLTKGPMKDAQVLYLNAFRAADVRPDGDHYVAWDAAWIVIDALKKSGLDATAPQIRDAIAGLRGWVGAHGTFDFRAFPGRGIGASSVSVARWDAANDTVVNVSAAGGALLKERTAR